MPALGIGPVAHGSHAGAKAGDVRRGRDHEKPLGPGKSLEADVLVAAYDAVGAIRADQPFALQSLPMLGGDGDAFRVLPERGDLRGEADVEQRIVLECLVDDAGELELLGLQAIGMAGQVGDFREVEGAEFAIQRRTVLHLRGLESLLDELPGEAEVVEHVQGRWMEGGGAGFLAQEFAFLQYRDGDAGAHQIGGGRHADRTGASDDDGADRLAHKYSMLEKKMCRRS